MQLPVPVQVSLRRVPAAKTKNGQPGKGHVMVNRRSICGEPVDFGVFITIAEFAADACGKCRSFIDRLAD